MSCKECDEFQETGNVFFYRWDNANIGILACKKHASEIINKLNEIQRGKKNE